MRRRSRAAVHYEDPGAKYQSYFTPSSAPSKSKADYVQVFRRHLEGENDNVPFEQIRNIADLMLIMDRKRIRGNIKYMLLNLLVVNTKGFTGSCLIGGHSPPTSVNCLTKIKCCQHLSKWIKPKSHLKGGHDSPYTAYRAKD